MMELTEYQIKEKCKQLNHLQDNPFLYRIMTLKTLVSLFSIKGYCSVIWLNRWFSEKDKNNSQGKVYSFHHTGNPPFLLRKAWESHIKSGNSIIEQAIWEKYKNKKYGFVTAQEVLEKRSLITNIVGWLAKSARLGEMGYLWIRPNDNDFWIFCLRKKRYEVPFTENEKSKILQIAETLLAFRKDWFKGFYRSLTERELTVFDLKCQGLTDKEISMKLNISEHVVGNEVAEVLKFWKKNEKAIGAITQENTALKESSIDFLFPTELPKQLKELITYQDWKIIRNLVQYPLKKRNEIAEMLNITESYLNVQIHRINKKLNTEHKQNNYIKCIVKILSILNDDVDF